MININDIRQGNHVKYAIKKYWAPIIQGIMVQVDGDIYRDIDANPDLFDPVPLSSDILNISGFKKLTPVFNNIQMPYWIHECVCLFYNETPPYDTFLAGYGFMINGEYVAATFKWIHYLHELENIFKDLNQKELSLNL